MDFKSPILWGFNSSFIGDFPIKCEILLGCLHRMKTPVALIYRPSPHRKHRVQKEPVHEALLDWSCQEMPIHGVGPAVSSPEAFSCRRQVWGFVTATPSYRVALQRQVCHASTHFTLILTTSIHPLLPVRKLRPREVK